LAIVVAILIWGIVYQEYHAAFCEFLPGSVPDEVARLGDGDLAKHGNDDHGAGARAVRHRAAPGSTNIPLMVGAITFSITAIAAVAAGSARETYRLPVRSRQCRRDSDGEAGL
jgi:hypothetical protein